MADSVFPAPPHACPVCSQLLPPTAKFCMECGASLKPRCARCGTEAPPRAKFCMECGQPVGPVPGGTSLPFTAPVSLPTSGSSAHP
jgi:predicted amidophosphoribosyltransferase